MCRQKGAGALHLVVGGTARRLIMLCVALRKGREELYMEYRRDVWWLPMPGSQLLVLGVRF